MTEIIQFYNRLNFSIARITGGSLSGHNSSDDDMEEKKKKEQKAVFRWGSHCPPSIEDKAMSSSFNLCW